MSIESADERDDGHDRTRTGMACDQGPAERMLPSGGNAVASEAMRRGNIATIVMLMSCMTCIQAESLHVHDLSFLRLAG
jgi:hypothetical protein